MGINVGGITKPRKAPCSDNDEGEAVTVRSGIQPGIMLNRGSTGRRLPQSHQPRGPSKFIYRSLPPSPVFSPTQQPLLLSTGRPYHRAALSYPAFASWSAIDSVDPTFPNLNFHLPTTSPVTAKMVADALVYHPALAHYLRFVATTGMLVSL